MGIDPGTTTGVAVLDLRGNLLHLSSSKDYDDSTVLKILSEYGKPIVVATDVSHVPERVKRIASQVGARLWVPEKDVPVDVKEEIARRFSYNRSGPEDDHQRDALAAAFLAFRFYAPKFRQVEKRTEGDRGLEEFVKKAVVFGQSMDRAIQEYKDVTSVRDEKKAVEQKRSRKADTSELLKKIAHLREEIREKDRTIEELRRRLAEVEEENARLRRIVARMPSDEKMELLRMQRDEARRELSRLRRRFRKLESIIDRIGEGKYVVIRRENARNSVYETEEYAVVEPGDEEREEDLAERIARLIEEYRARRK